MANNVIDKEAARQEAIDQTVSATEKFYNENKKVLWGTLAAVIVLGLAVLGYVKFVYQPKCAEAMEQAFPAEINFQNGEFELALNGDGNTLGFAEIISEYGAKAGKSIYLSAGICELQLGNFESALSYLGKYSGKEPILAARAKACEGDAHVGLGDYQAAVKCFNAAAKMSDNVFAADYLLKAGLAYEALGNKAAALDCYNTIKNEYPQSIEAYDIAKNIARVTE